MTGQYKAKGNAAFHLHSASSALEVFSEQITKADADQLGTEGWEDVEHTAYVIEEAVDMLLKSLRNKLPNI